MSDRPDYVKCVLLGLARDRTTWCGRTSVAMEFVFTEPTHALLNARNNGRLLICEACSKAMGEALAKGTYER